MTYIVQCTLRLIANVATERRDYAMHFTKSPLQLTCAEMCLTILSRFSPYSYTLSVLLPAIVRCCNLQMNVSLHCRRNGRSLRNRYGRGSGPIWLDDLHCTGTESQLASCRHNGWGRNNCGHHEDVSIQCVDDYVSTPSTTAIVPGTYTTPSNDYK